MDTAALIAAIGLAYAAAGTAIGLVIRVAIKWTRQEDRMAAIALQLAEVITDWRRDRAEILERVLYLERAQWQTMATRAPAPPAPVWGRTRGL